MTDLKELRGQLERATEPGDASEAFASLVGLLKPDIGEKVAIRILSLWVYGAYESAAIALVDAKLPGAGWEVAGTGYAEINLLDGRFLINEDTEVCANHKNPPIALLIALLKALEAQEEENG